VTVAALQALLDTARPGVPRLPAPWIPHTALRRQDPDAHQIRRRPLMATMLRLPGGSADVVDLVDALLAAADARERRAPRQAARWRELAHQLGDALDTLPTSRAQEGTP
jgi:hypothetical protein